MSLFRAVDYALFIQLHQLKIFNIFSSQVIKIDFPESILNYQEIKNSEKFDELIQAVLKNEKLINKKGIIILSEEVIFEKIVSNDEISKNLQQINLIFDEIPLTPSQLRKKIIKTKTETILWGANKTIFEEIIKVVENNGWKILAIVPINAFPKLKGQNYFQGSMFLEIMHDKRYLSQVDFLNIEEEVDLRSNNNYFFVFFILLILFGVGLVFYYFNGYQYISKISLKKNIVPTSVAVKTQKFTTPTPIIKKINLTDYEIVILNGSGKKGEAAVLQKQLEDNGYIVTKIDNANSSDYEKTIMLARENILSDYLDELKKFLDKIYEVEDKIATADAGVDLQIIIGKNTR